MERLRAIMAILRDPERGCDWDKAQTSASIARYAIEEAYEFVDAVASGDAMAMRDELGDLLLQVVFHSRIAEEAGLFDFDAVARGICDKMIRRHPHVFDTLPQNASFDWEAIKAAERARSPGAQQTGALSGVANALPALVRAQKIQSRAARVGFDWPDATGPAAKVFEEIAEVAAATTNAERVEEIGDLLFSVVNLARHHGVDAETALRDATAKFEHRFAAMEAVDGPPLNDLSLDELESRWQAAKSLNPRARDQAPATGTMPTGSRLR